MAKDYEETDWDNWEYNENEEVNSKGREAALGNDGSWTSAQKEEKLIFKDANWNILSEWDTVAAIKDIKVKWTKDIKRGDKFPKIRLTDDVKLIESWKMVLKTEFFKKI